MILQLRKHDILKTNVKWSTASRLGKIYFCNELELCAQESYIHYKVQKNRVPSYVGIKANTGLLFFKDEVNTHAYFCYFLGLFPELNWNLVNLANILISSDYVLFFVRKQLSGSSAPGSSVPSGKTEQSFRFPGMRIRLVSLLSRHIRDGRDSS